MPPARAPSPRATVAVVAVHGVADQAAHSSAQAIAALLLQESGPRYTAAHEITLEIPTRPPVLTSQPTGRNGRPSATIFDDDRAGADESLARSTAPAPDAAPDHQLMLSQLSEYRASGRPYRTVRLETQRLDDRGEPEADVHVYEMYWADLSRLGTGMLRFFGELYQLLFHSASLGRQTLDYAALEHGDDGTWAALRLVHRWLVRILTLFIPSIALVILGIGAIPMALMPSAAWQPAVAIALFGAAAGLLIAHRQWRLGPPSSFGWWTIRSVVSIVAATASLRWIFGRSGASLAGLLLVEWTVVSGLLLLLVFRAYDRYRPAARRIGVTLYVLAAVTFLILLLTPGAGRDPGRLAPVVARATRAVLWTIEGLWWLGLLAWAILLLVSIVGWGLGAWAVHKTRKAARQAPGDGERAAAADRAARALRTSRLTLALPAAAFILVTTILWYVVVGATVAMVERSDLAPMLELRHCRPVGACGTVRELLTQLLWGITTLGVPLATLLLALGLGLLTWWVVPIAATEVRPLRGDAERDRSESMGRWLTGGLAYALTSVTALVAATVFVGAAGFVLSSLVATDGRAEADGLLGTARSLAVEGGRIAAWAIGLVGGFLVAGAVGVLALRRGRLEALSRAVRPVLDVILDVDGYLREHPRESTPRARIAERYVSLLRYLCAWRNPLAPDEPYRAIILVAHSQGTVISADLLGFLQRDRDPALDPIVRPHGSGGAPIIPTYFFTMGSPLRQLYEQFFPHLYSWVTRRPLAWQRMDLVPETAVAMLGPDPAAIRVSRWVNAYRSGDYIGRSLWLPDDPGSFMAGARGPDGAGGYCDVCIGAGAHTHYWDSGTVARELDELVALAAEPPPFGPAPRGTPGCSGPSRARAGPAVTLSEAKGA